MRALLVVVVLVSIVAVYAAALATVSLIRDDTLTIPGKLLRLLGVWLIPLLGALFVLRAAYDLCPGSLPARKWLMPLKPILYVSARRSTGLEAEMDMFQSAEQHQPGQGIHHID